MVKSTIHYNDFDKLNQFGIYLTSGIIALSQVEAKDFFTRPWYCGKFRTAVYSATITIATPVPLRLT